MPLLSFSCCKVTSVVDPTPTVALRIKSTLQRLIHTPSLFSCSVWFSHHHPLPLWVISCISCVHVSPAVLTQRAQSRDLNPCHCPSPKPEGSSQKRILCHSLSKLMSALKGELNLYHTCMLTCAELI